MSLKPSTDLSGHITTHFACGSETSSNTHILTIAGATEDGVKVTGATIDRLNGTSLAESAVVSTIYQTTLTAAKTLSFAYEIQESADNSTWDTAVALATSTVAKTGAAADGKDVQGPDDIAALAINLVGRKRYWRINVTPDLSHTSTDSCWWATMAIQGGYEQLPK